MSMLHVHPVMHIQGEFFCKYLSLDICYLQFAFPTIIIH